MNDTVVAAGEMVAMSEMPGMNEAYIRVLLTRGVGELTYDLKSTPAPTVVIIVKPLEEPAARVFNDGIPTALVQVLRNHPGSVNPIIKSNNLLNNALAMQKANRRGAEEAPRGLSQAGAGTHVDTSRPVRLSPGAWRLESTDYSRSNPLRLPPRIASLSLVERNEA